MIYTPMTQKAMGIAFDAHNGQTDKAGIPYIFHPIHLAEQMPDEVSCTVALLHDVMEDTAVTRQDLAAVFPAEVMDALDLLTHEKGSDYFEYVRKIPNNPVALRVKLADLAHNSDESRLSASQISKDQLLRLREKYAVAKAILTESGE